MWTAVELCSRFLVFFTVRFVRADKAAAWRVESHSQPIVWHENLNGWHIISAQHGEAGSMSHPLTIALHGLLGCQDERREAGERLRQLQERMLQKRKQHFC